MWQTLDMSTFLEDVRSGGKGFLKAYPVLLIQGESVDFYQFTFTKKRIFLHFSRLSAAFVQNWKVQMLFRRQKLMQNAFTRHR